MATGLVKINEHPRMTVNKLGEYLVEESPSKRRRLLASQRMAPRCRVIRYNEARRSIMDFLAEPDHDRALAALGDRLGALAGWMPGPTDSVFDAREKAASRSALEAFAELAPNLGDGLAVTRGANIVPKLEIGGVQISVRPDLVLRGKGHWGRPFVGAVKFHFARSAPLNDRSGAIVAALLHEYAEAHLADPASGERVDPKRCLVLDLASRRIYTAPGTHARLLGEVEEACREIAARWSSLPI